MSRDRFGAISAIAWADVLERVRRFSFLATLGLVLWLGAGTFDGSVSVNVGDAQGFVNSAWAGGMMAVVAITFLSLLGFWIVKNAVARDERTGVGPILATTPLSRVEYTIGKATSHFLVLAAMTGVLVLCGLVLLLMQGRGSNGAGGPFDAFAYVAPFLFCGVPAFALTASIAILFETTPGLRGGWANALWIVVWTILLMTSMGAKTPLMDPWGILIVQKSMAAAAQAQLGVNPEHFSIEMNPGMARAEPVRFLWHGVTWTPAILLSRLAWLGVSIGIAALAAVPFHRFDPSRMRFRVALPGRAAAAAEKAKAKRPAIDWGAFLPGGLLGSELKLLVGGANGWWALGALGIAIACWIVPLAKAPATILVAAWIWPLLRWSSLGGRDAHAGTEAFVLTAPGALTRQLPAAWAAGVIVALVIGLGVGARQLLAADLAGFTAWFAGALFIPAFALALGLASRGPRLFEVSYAILWYIGPGNRTPALDFMGATGKGDPRVWFAATAIALAVAFALRARQLRGN